MITFAQQFHDYRSTMQAYALLFLQAHQAEYLGDNTPLIERAIHHLVEVLDVPLFMAPHLVQLAYGELPPHAWFGFDLAAGPDSTAYHAQ